MARRSPTRAARRRTSGRSRTSATSTPRRSPAPRRSSAAPGLLQVAPVATYAGLRGDTLVRLTPHDGVGAHAIAAWLAEHGVDDVLIVHDYGDEYGEPVGAMCAQAARERGLAVRIRPGVGPRRGPGGRPRRGARRPLRRSGRLGRRCAVGHPARREPGSVAPRQRRRGAVVVRPRDVARRGAAHALLRRSRACRWPSTATRRWRSLSRPSPPARAIAPPPPAPRAPPAIAARSSGATPSTPRATPRPPPTVASPSSTARSSGTYRRTVWRVD